MLGEGGWGKMDQKVNRDKFFEEDQGASRRLLGVGR